MHFLQRLKFSVCSGSRPSRRRHEGKTPAAWEQGLMICEPGGDHFPGLLEFRLEHHAQRNLDMTFLISGAVDLTKVFRTGRI
jgi:hypothetical protein